MRRDTSRKRLPVAAALLGVSMAAFLGLGFAQDPAAGPDDAADARKVLVETLARSGVQLDLERGAVNFPVQVVVRDDLLEFLLVARNGALHESMFVTDVRPSVLNTAILSLGLTPGTNAKWEVADGTKDPDRRGGRHDFDVTPPRGDGLFLYVAWREDGETYFHRVDDLIANLETRRSLRRHRWVFLGSRFQVLREGQPEVFLADVEGNLINVSFFYQGNTLITGALPECIRQTVWVPNTWLLPPTGSELRFILSKERIDRLPTEWENALPLVAPSATKDAEDGR